MAEEAEGATRSSSSSGGGSSTGRWQTTQRPGEAKKQATAGAAGRLRRVLGRRRGWRHCPSLRVAWKRDEWSRDMMVFAGTPDDADWWRRGRGKPARTTEARRGRSGERGEQVAGEDAIEWEPQWGEWRLGGEKRQSEAVGGSRSAGLRIVRAAYAIEKSRPRDCRWAPFDIC